MGTTKENTQLPGPWRITFDTNPDDCNLHCIMCEEHSDYSRSRRPDGWKPRRMDYGIIERVVEEVVATGDLKEIIPSTMGEPLLYKHFDDIIDLCHQHAIKLNLTTNGTFPRLGAEDWAHRIVPVANDVKISCNGAQAETAERIMRGLNFEQTLDNVRDFIHVRDSHTATTGKRCSITFQLTYMELNLTEIPEIVKLGVELGVDRIKGHHLWVHHSMMTDQSLRRSEEAAHRWNGILEKVNKVREKYRLPSGQKILLDNFYPLDETGQFLQKDTICPFLEREAWINTEGRFDPCCAPDYLRKDLGSFGFVHDTSFLEIWFGAKYRDLCANYEQQQVCQNCNMRKPRTEMEG